MLANMLVIVQLNLSVTILVTSPVTISHLSLILVIMVVIMQVIISALLIVQVILQ